LSPVAYKLRLPANVKLHPVFHVSRLEPFIPDTFNRPPRRHPEALVNDAAHEYRVGAISDVAYASDGSCLLFRVRWAEPYDDPRHDTWEPFTGVQDCAALSDFLSTETWRLFSRTKDFQKFSRLHPRGVPE